MALAGVAAEGRYLAHFPPEDDPVVAISDLAEWQEASHGGTITPKTYISRPDPDDS